jgi:hypothetical protein
MLVLVMEVAVLQVKMVQVQQDKLVAQVHQA